MLLVVLFLHARMRDPARAHAVDAHLGPEAHGERMRERDAAALRCGIGFGVRLGLQRARRGDAGTVDRRIEAAEALHHLAHAGAHRRFPRNVAPDEEHAARSGMFHVDHRHPVAALDKEPRDVICDALRATGDQGGL